MRKGEGPRGCEPVACERGEGGTKPLFFQDFAVDFGSNFISFFTSCFGDCISLPAAAPWFGMRCSGVAVIPLFGMRCSGVGHEESQKSGQYQKL